MCFSTTCSGTMLKPLIRESGLSGRRLQLHPSNSYYFYFGKLVMSVPGLGQQMCLIAYSVSHLAVLRSCSPGFASSANTWHQIHSPRLICLFRGHFLSGQICITGDTFFSKLLCVCSFMPIGGRRGCQCSISLAVDMLQELYHCQIVVPKRGRCIYLHWILAR